jgi:hypothetical protein
MGRGTTSSDAGGGALPTTAFVDARTNRRTPARRAASRRSIVWTTFARNDRTGSSIESTMSARAARWTTASAPSTARWTAPWSSSEASMSSCSTPSR